ncbi:hypothetical protein [Sinorhizobium meliloti]|uniref:hypothetical protein n=1 Tax=Rhizobium meliloti TaxID=382 RepID=UPI000FDC2AF8|nr:hypothetical protein [Sinorhizobium meliloti]MDW9928074.1 hypothetical protein [Sinorhizobium meliloti]MDX0966381.1 hypothetical protein [Sinorhizobium medicae]RVI41808.1 hypothetical protein CN195_30910 [Sinorhizobium meliloti]
MTVVAMKPFHGATREGVEFIERWIRESRTRTGYLIVSTAAKHGEALSEIATSSKAAYEMQWAHFSNLRAIGVTTKRDEVIYFGANLALYSFFLLLIGWLAPGLLGGAIGDMVRSLSSFGIAVLSVGGVVWARLLGEFLESRGLGYADLFTGDNTLALRAWGISDSAIYIVEHDVESGSPRSRRIPNSCIKEFAFDATPLGNRTSLFEIDGTRHDLYEPAGRYGANHDQLRLILNDRSRVEVRKISDAE